MVVAIVTIMLIPQSPACALPTGLPARADCMPRWTFLYEATGPGFQQAYHHCWYDDAQQKKGGTQLWLAK